VEGETLSQLIYRLEDNLDSDLSSKATPVDKTLPEWYAAIAALESLLLSTVDLSPGEKIGGLVLSLPTSVIRSQTLLNQLQLGIFTSKQFKTHFLPACEKSKPTTLPDSILELPIKPYDHLSREPFCLVITPKFSLILLCGEAGFQFSFNPRLVEEVWLRLKRNLVSVQSEHLTLLENLVEKLGFTTPDYQIVVNFSRQLLQNIPNFTNSIPKAVTIPSQKKETATIDLDVQLLQALTHEVRTPLTTIRTLTQLLLKRIKPGPEISKHLEVIEQECTAQINRMELIFRAAQLKTTTQPQQPLHLVPISLEQVLQESIPRWQQQAQRRQISLEVSLPHKLPAVVSDPAVLDQMLTNLIEQFTRNLPAGGHIQVEVSTAGNQLKLRFQTNSATQNNFFKSLGKLLIFQPETGNLCLNPNATKNLFRSLGGRLTVRQRQGRGEVLTIFLPLIH